MKTVSVYAMSLCSTSACIMSEEEDGCVATGIIQAKKESIPRWVILYKSTCPACLQLPRLRKSTPNGIPTNYWL